MEKIFIKIRKNLWINRNDIIEVRSDDPQKATITYRDLTHDNGENFYRIVHLDCEESVNFLAWLDEFTINLTAESESRQPKQQSVALAESITNKILADYAFHGEFDCLRKDIIQRLAAAMSE